jgi:hypothetical protein
VRFLRAFVAAAVLLLCGARASAQTPEPDERATLQDTTGIFWGVATFEIVTTAGTILPLLLDCETDVCNSLGPLLGMVSGLSLGLAGWLAEWPADVPFVAHTSYIGFASGLLLGSGVAGLASGGNGQRVTGTSASALTAGLVTGAVTGLALGTYTTLRRDDFVRNPDLLGPGHMLAWGTMAVLTTLGLLLAFSDADEPVLATILGVSATVFIGGMIAWAEVARR